MNRMVRIVLVLACVLALLLVAGCGMIAQKAAEKGIEGATGGKVDISGDEVTIKGEDGSSATISDDTQLPADFPSEVPLMDGGKLKAAVTGEDGGKKRWTLNYTYPSTTQEVMAFYTDALAKDGWKTSTSANVPNGGMLGAENGTYKVELVIGEGDGTDGAKSMMTMSVSAK